MRKRRIMFGVSISLKKSLANCRIGKIRSRKTLSTQTDNLTNDGRDPAEGVWTIAAWNVAAAVV